MYNRYYHDFEEKRLISVIIKYWFKNKKKKDL